MEISKSSETGEATVDTMKTTKIPHMKVTASKNSNNKNNVSYYSVEVYDTFVNDDMSYCLHESHNKLFKCFMVSEKNTGFVLKTFPVKDKENDEERILIQKKAQSYVEGLDNDVILVMIKGYAEVNVKETHE